MNETTMQNLDILEALEDLAQTFPWDEVAIWITREPKGVYGFTATLGSNLSLGFDFDCYSGQTLVEVVGELKRRWLHKRDPELTRAAKVRELKEQIAKLQAVVIGLPPYQPNRELREFNPIPPAAPVIEVDSTRDDVPF